MVFDIDFDLVFFFGVWDGEVGVDFDFGVVFGLGVYESIDNLGWLSVIVDVVVNGMIKNGENSLWRVNDVSKLKCFFVFRVVVEIEFEGGCWCWVGWGWIVGWCWRVLVGERGEWNF